MKIDAESDLRSSLLDTSVQRPRIQEKYLQIAREMLTWKDMWRHSDGGGRRHGDLKRKRREEREREIEQEDEKRRRED